MSRAPDNTNEQQESPESRRSPDTLTRAEAWLHEALEGAKMLGWELDLATNQWTSTADLPTFYGLPPDNDYTNADLAALAIHPDDMQNVLAQRQRAIDTGEPMRYEFRGRIPAPDGLVRWFATRGRALRDASGKPVRLVAVTTDVTERKQAETMRAALDQQLLDAQKWESLGVLAGGVAHDFNNILTIILGSAGLARRGVQANSAAASHLEQIEQASRRAADLCRQLLAYTGRGYVPSGEANANELIKSSAALLGVQASNAANLKLELGENLPAIRADAAQVRQVLINLAMNAAEALGDAEGEIRIKTEFAEITDEPATGYHLPPKPGHYVRLAVSDTGPGIPPDVKAHMFDPFFTTKFAGRGLGLSAVLGIMRLHGGAIRVTTAPGHTTVEALWPAVGEQPLAVDQPEAPPAAPKSRGKALVIDDEMFVREVAASALQELGYEPLLAGDGQTAFQLFLKHRSDVRLVVLDVMMPGMTGDQVLEALRTVNPTLPAVVMSGYTDRRAIRTGPGTRTEFLQKPFHPEELFAIAEQLLKTGV